MLTFFRGPWTIRIADTNELGSQERAQRASVPGPPLHITGTLIAERDE